MINSRDFNFGFAGFMILLLNLGCSKKSQVQKYYYKHQMPVAWENGIVDNSRDSTIIYFYKNYALLQMPLTTPQVTLTESDGEKIDTIQYESKSRPFQTNYYYCLFDTSKDTGYTNFKWQHEDWKNSLSKFANEKWRSCSYDSILKRKFFEDVPFEKMVLLGNLVSVSNQNKDGIIFKRYHTPYSENIQDGDTIELAFDKKANSIPFFISKKLDDANNSKLVGFKIIFNEKLYKPTNVLIPRREMFMEMRSLPVENEQEIINFIETFQKLHPDL